MNKPAQRPQLGAGVAGLGVGEQHARTLGTHRAIGTVWLYDSRRERAESVASNVPRARVAETFTSLLENPEVHIISIASFDDAHFGQVTAALAAGKHVFVEKPMCRTIDELREIKRLWTGAGQKLRLGSNLVLRAAPLYRWLKDSIAGGVLGELFAFDGDYLYGRLHKITDGWRQHVGEYSVMLGGGIHLLDMMLWLTGRRPVSVTATGNRISSRDTAFRYDDFRAATLRFEDGMVGRITANFGCVHAHHHVLRVFGTAATFIYDDAGARLHESRDPASKPRAIEAAPLATSKGDLIPGFVESIVNDTDYTYETQTVFDGISVAIACDRAAASGKSEDVEYV